MSLQQSVTRNSFTLLAVGAVVGAGVALLYAPRSGQDTRKLLATKARLLRDQTQVTCEKAQEFIRDGKTDLAAAFDSAKEMAGDPKS